MDLLGKFKRWCQTEFWDFVKDLELDKHPKAQMMFNGAAIMLILVICAAILGKNLVNLFEQ